MKNILLAAFAVLVVVVAPSHAENFGSSVSEGMALARMAAENGEDMALSALYQRLFVLQDKRRETEQRSDEAELAIDDLALGYRRFDDRMTSGLLREIAGNPDHRDYPNLTETAKLAVMASVREKLRVQKLGVLELKRIARDTEEVKALIAENLARRPRTPAKS